MDYKKLLLEYMRIVGIYEGISYATKVEESRLTREERKELIRLEQEEAN